MVKSIYPRCCICCAVPCVLITSCHIVCGVFVLTDIEVESVSAGASIIVCIVIGVNATLSIVDFVPRELFTGILVIRVVGAVIDCQVEGVDVGAG